MEAAPSSSTCACSHLVTMPYPARGYINPMMNFCKMLLSNDNTRLILVTFVVTEEWLGFIGSDSMRFATIPNVVPSDHPGFLEAVMTKMEASFEELLNRLQPPPTAIVSDTFLYWAVVVGSRRNIPVALFSTMSASIFFVLHHHHLLVNLSGNYFNRKVDSDIHVFMFVYSFIIIKMKKFIIWSGILRFVYCFSVFVCWLSM